MPNMEDPEALVPHMTFTRKIHTASKFEKPGIVTNISTSYTESTLLDHPVHYLIPAMRVDRQCVDAKSEYDLQD